MSTQYGFFSGVCEAEYSRIPAHRFSELKHLEKSPLSYLFHRDNKVESTAPQKLGNVIHSLVLEPGSIPVAVWPGPGIRRGAAYDAWCLANAGAMLVNETEYQGIIGAINGIMSNPAAARYLKGGDSELTMCWQDKTSGRDFKARIDKRQIFGDRHVLVSLKSTVSADGRLFANQFVKYCWAAQDAIYQSGYFALTKKLPDMVMIAAEKTAPYESAVFHIGLDILRMGQQQASTWIARLKQCEQSGKWPGAVDGEEELILPNWAFPEGDYEHDDMEAAVS